jgi:hypothetical protein
LAGLALILAVPLGARAQVVTNLVQNGGFENGVGIFSPWVPESSSIGEDIFWVSPASPHSGALGLFSGVVGTPAFIRQTLPTTPGRTYLLSLWASCSIDVGNSMPNQFVIQWNSTYLLNQTNMVLPVFPAWTNLQFAVTASSSSALLRIGMQDDPDLMYLDDVSVSVPPPALQSITATNGAVGLTWTAVPTHSYQLSYKSDLMDTNWTTLGGPITATNFTMSASDAVGPNFRRYYRVQLQN